MNDQGAQMQVKAMQLISNVLQALVVLVLAFVANNLWQVNLTIAENSVVTKSMLADIADIRSRQDIHATQLKQLDRDVAVIEGRITRSPTITRGYGDGK
jgi:hypothetical protein